MGIFPDRAAMIRLVGAVSAEQHDEWIESRRYLGLNALSRYRRRADHCPRGHRRAHDPSSNGLNPP